MKWKTVKSIKRVKPRPFLVLPLIEVDEHKAAMPKNPGLRLFTKTFSKPDKVNDENCRPLTATLDKPQVLDIRLITKIDMSLMRKEFLCITNLCRIPLAVSKARRKPSVFNQRRPNTRPLSLPSNTPKKLIRPGTSEDSWEDEQSSASQTPTAIVTKKPQKMNKIKPPASTPSKKQVKKTQNDANNNFNTYRVSRKRTVIDSKLPQPCKTCGRPDQPERFHSHPETPLKPLRKMEEKVPVKNTVQKPVAMKYKSKTNDKNTSPMKKSPIIKAPSTPSIKEEEKSPKRVASAKGPRTLTCYICAREFGTTSLPLHEPKCLEKWERENGNLPPQLRRKQPVKPQRGLTRDEYNTYAWESSQANLVPCRNCGRTFYPDRLVVHQRSCKFLESPNMSKLQRSNEQPPSQDATPHSVQPKGVHCSICGRMFGTKSIKFHEPQCLKKWHMQNDHLPPNQREPMYSQLAKATEENPPNPEPIHPPERTSSPKKPPMFPCYLCGRLFSVNSIYIHEPQCLKRWRIENEKLPLNKRKNEPLKPDVKFTRDGNIDHHAMAEANWQSHLEHLVPCKNCGRTFNPDRVCVHEKTCKGPNKKNNDIKIEIL